MFLSGRRALMLMTAIAPILTLLFRIFLPKEVKLTNRTIVFKTLISVFILILVILFFLNYIYGITISTLIDMFLEGFDFQGSASAIARKMQFFVLLNG